MVIFEDALCCIGLYFHGQNIKYLNMALNIYSDILGNILDEQIDCGIDLYMQLSARRERISALPKMLNCSYKCYHRVDSAPV